MQKQQRGVAVDARAWAFREVRCSGPVDLPDAFSCPTIKLLKLLLLDPFWGDGE